jgi:hypothetical protein
MYYHHQFCISLWVVGYPIICSLWKDVKSSSYCLSFQGRKSGLEALDYFVYLLTATRHHCSLSRRVSYKYVSVARAPKQTLGSKCRRRWWGERALCPSMPLPSSHRVCNIRKIGYPISMLSKYYRALVVRLTNCLSSSVTNLQTCSILHVLHSATFADTDNTGRN